jgi:hypothetical protein
MSSPRMSVAVRVPRACDNRAASIRADEYLFNVLSVPCFSYWEFGLMVWALIGLVEKIREDCASS